jgi:hypothetical protein
MIAPTRRTLSALTAVIALGAVLQTGCRRDAEPTGPLDWGSHRFTIAGAVAGESSGSAGYNPGTGWWYVGLSDSPESTSEWGVYFTQDAVPLAAGATIPVGPPLPHTDPRGPRPPPPSTHAMAEVAYLRRSDDQFFSWTANGGEIRVLTASRQRVSGTFELTAQQKDGRSLGPITVTGTFEAVCQPPFGKPSC